MSTHHRIILIVPCKITVEGVQKMLDKPNIHKAAGPDGISSRVLKELSSVIAPILISSTNHMKVEKFRRCGNKPMSYQSLQKAPNTIQVTHFPDMHNMQADGTHPD